ncbi:hypothetical protein ASF19_20125 [Acidovorax sp. Leaf84]|uniref:hypothetical protein n=1 Tax=Acidovorax sp. Leaf84 TaxID=1736240 RepID=UPI0006FA8AFA|nr:hypothetical protein [Acidovorax sp. Leaf84]KQO38084.1 hypothetical protein ASF19_20125 [Acidovorax sp. Leaf84]
MSNTAYPLGAQKMISGAINFLADTIKVAIVPTGYTYSTAHEFLSDIGAVVGTAQPLANKSIAGGVLDADDLNYGAMAPGSTAKALVLYKDTGNASTSPVLLYIDTATGLPAATNGGVITVPWDDSVKKIARMNLPFYPKGGEKVFAGAINFLTDTIKVRMLPASYVYDPAHEFLSQVSAGVGVDQTLAGKSVTGGVFDANDASFGAVAAGSSMGSVLIYKEGGSAATSPLLILFDDVVGLPYATNGAPYTQRWSDGATKIFSLVAP